MFRFSIKTFLPGQTQTWPDWYWGVQQNKDTYSQIESRKKETLFFVFIQLMLKRDMFHNPQIRYVGQWQGDILCDWKHTLLILTKAMKGELGYGFEPS